MNAHDKAGLGQQTGGATVLPSPSGRGIEGEGVAITPTQKQLYESNKLAKRLRSEEHTSELQSH